ncbi:MAG: nicotinate-nucleotide--dimethylbenzimidazole phosphoribosyltransferase [Actinomycetota bacterium]|nr:nicotinate-nucleotide--dimethylbenzimidazole phosphoribosyltransferase [Actinomycetota bacterium]
MPPAGAFAAAVARLAPPEGAAGRAAAEHHDRLTKPPGSLGRLEATGVRLAAIAGRSPPPVPEPAVVAVFAADHGVVAEGVTPWPQEVTAQMVANVAAGGAAVNVLARHGGASVVVVDVGVATELGPMDRLWRRKVRPGTGNLAVEAAMTRDEAGLALDAGAEVADRLVAAGGRCLVTGDLGIGNTTSSAALVAALTGQPPGEVTGRGTGVDDATLARKVAVVERGLARAGGWSDPVDLLATVGGLEIGALAGFVVGGAAARVPVVIDGLIAAAATLVAAALAPGAVDYCFAGHRSTEPGASAALDHLGLEPLVDLGMRLGEGSGACLGLPVLQAAAKVLREMATFDSAGVSAKELGGLSPRREVR